MNEVDNILEVRGSSYGDWPIQSQVSQSIKRAMKHSPNWPKLPPPHRESLEMIAVKISRILNGDYNHADSWEDIAGYATLAERICNSEAE